MGVDENGNTQNVEMACAKYRHFTRGGIRPENVFHYRDLGFQEIHTSSRNTEGQLDIEQLKMMVEAMKGVPL